MSDTYMYNVMWKAAMKHSYTDKKRAQKPCIAHRDSNIRHVALNGLRQDPPPPLIWVFGHFWLFCTMISKK